MDAEGLKAWEEVMKPYRETAKKPIPENTIAQETFLKEITNVSGDLRDDKVKLYNLISRAKEYDNELKQLEKTLKEKGIATWTCLKR